MVEAGRRFTSLSIPKESGLVYGKCPHPLSCGLGLTIGAGTVFPEVNFTLPSISITAQSWADVKKHCEEMAAQILRRAVALSVPGIVLSLNFFRL